MNEIDIEYEIKKIANIVLNVKTVSGAELSKNLKEFKLELLDYAKKVMIQDHGRSDEVEYVAIRPLKDGDFDKWKDCGSDLIFYQGDLPGASTTLHGYIRRNYNCGFVELLLNPRTGGKTDRWDLAEIAVFNWIAEEITLRGWCFAISLKTDIELKEKNRLRAKPGGDLSDAIITNVDKLRELFNLRELSNNQTLEDNAYTRSPIFIVQDLEFVARVDEEYYDEGDFDNDSYRHEYFNEDGSLSKESAIEEIQEAIDDKCQKVLDAIEEYPEYKTDYYHLKYVWKSLSDYGARGSSLCRYIYRDQNWFLTRKNAEEYIQRKSYDFNKPRIYVKSLWESDFSEILKTLGFKHYQ
jgi:ribosomal protein L29